MTEFEMHPQLLRDAHYLGRFPSSHVLLHKNAALPWFIFVPQTKTTDLLDLSDDLRQAIMREAAIVSGFIKTELGFGKVNFASIGNVVPQLHLHVVGRRPGDPCWPSPVWGNLRETREYAASELNDLVAALQRHAPQFVVR